MKQYIVKHQQGGYISMDAWKDKLRTSLTSKRDATKTPTIQTNSILHNFLTGNAVTQSDAEQKIAGIPQIVKPTDQGTISTPQTKSVREKMIQGLNWVDRSGDNPIAAIVTQPLKSALTTLRPDKYFEGVQNDDDVIGAVGKLAGDAAMVAPAMQEVNWLRKGARGAIALGDSQFSKVGRALEDVSIQGRGMGLNDQQIAANQLDKVGITANQRKGYMPVISDVLHDYIQPFGYPNSIPDLIDRFKEGNGLARTAEDVRLHPEMNQDGLYDTDLHRNDAWRTYLGMPQQNNTFRMAENESSFPVKAGEDRYSLNYDHTKDFKKNTSWMQSEGLAGDMNVMGNYNVRPFSNGTTEYWDRWDLDPKIDIPFSKAKLTPLIDDGYSMGDELVKPKITIPVSKFLGKPFVSNGIINHNIPGVELHLPPTGMSDWLTHQLQIFTPKP